MRFALVIYDEKQRCFMPAYSSELPSGWAMPHRGTNRQHLVVPRSDYARQTYQEVIETLQEWGYQPYEIARDNFFWFHDLKAEYPQGLVAICNYGGEPQFPMRLENVYPANWNQRFLRAHAAWAPQFKDIPKAVGVVAHLGNRRYLPMLFELTETAMPDSFSPKHEYRYLERTEHPLPTLARAQQQFARMSLKPARVLGVNNVSVGNYEEADIRLFLGSGRFDTAPDIKIREKDIQAVELTYPVNPPANRPAFT